MPVICPTVLAADKDSYRIQLETVANFGHRIQIDLSDGIFTPNKTIDVNEVWWPTGIKADIHLMYKQPLGALKALLSENPNMVIVHSEASGNFDETYRLCRDKGVKLGVALLPSTQPSVLKKSLDKIDHILIFSGDLGSFGGTADLSLLEKAAYIKNEAPDIEIGWDGGINDLNISELVFGGIEVLNVGGFIQKSDHPEKAYNKLFRIAEETGTT
jgi:ribulose-phosphate 3-epimerase